ncbi:WYL domain-containing protein [Streptomyces sp. NPDC006739]|uniref:WYL domain-containing protein n=1 Tax=Streptomyces sp. NPDC006739 TaxID=3364763 RepID=UPI003673CF1B
MSHHGAAAVLQRRDRTRKRPRSATAGLLTADGRWDLIAWCRTRRAGRGFRPDRIAAAAPTGEQAQPHELAELLLGVAGLLGEPLVNRCERVMCRLSSRERRAEPRATGPQCPALL